uniref:Uncharacterized protein n=1 Tax=Plectus sambesii TaxID=2011161 RepID=A0A914XQL1_9BILA
MDSGKPAAYLPFTSQIRRTLTVTTCLQTTITAINCPDPRSLVSTPDGRLTVGIPAANTNGAFSPIGTTVAVTCGDAGTDPATIGAGIVFDFDTVPQAIQDVDNFPPGNFEMFTMTCQPSGLWLVSMQAVPAPPTPVSGIISAPGAIQCNGCIGMLNAYCTPG